tara:strand:- start:270 stop:1601 length:1332 start_codon:yes stop_codon:yes gene_type:complete
MARFNGNNDQGVLQQFLERGNFSATAYDSVSAPLTPMGDDPREPSPASARRHTTHVDGPFEDGLYPRPVKDFNFAERVLYGRINKAHQPIFLKKSNLKTLRNDSSEGALLQAVDFVADSFNNFVTQWQGAATTGRLDLSDPYLTTIEPLRAFVDYDQKYNAYKADLRNTFIEVFVTKERNERITDFESFMKIFWDYILELSSAVPITKTSFVTSRFAGPMISGLCIEVADFDASNDADKERFINSLNFGFYKLFARNNGFSIDKQVPWRLVADIASPQMLQYSAPYGFNDESAILRNCYGVAGAQDILDLKEMAIDFYNVLVAKSPVLRIPASLSYTSQCGDRYIRRSPVTIDQALSSYSLQFWVDKYIDIRYNEQKKPVSEGALSEIRKVVSRLIPYAQGERLAINYINSNIITFDNFRGSYAQRTLRRRNRETGENLHPTY